ncbi:MAG: flippase [Oscillospiraceae bacterium]|nr:flippase [Oscillospiraceae bacterium]
MENSNSYTKEIKNATWIIACRVIQFGLNIVVSLLSARYLGPERYGLTTYAASIASFFIPVTLMGLSDTLVRELSDSPSKEGEILGTSLVINALSSVISIAGMILTVFLLNRDDSLTVLFCGLYSISLLFQNYEIIGCWFQSKLMSRYASVSSLIAFAVSAAYRIYILSARKGILWFSATTVIDFGLISMLLFLFYRTSNGPKLSFSFETGKKLLQRSKYYIFTNIIVASFSSVDKILLKQMVGTDANGLYSAAFSVATATSFVYSAIIESLRPSIVSLAKTNIRSCENRTKTLFSLIIWISVIQNVIFSLFGGTFVRLMLGEEYLDAIPVFRVLTWFTTFSYMGSVRNVWILANDRHKNLWKINTLGAIAGLILNRLLIGSYGMTGAAITAIVTQLFTNFITGYLFEEIRPVNRLILDSLNPRYVWNFVSSVLREIFGKE